MTRQYLTPQEEGHRKAIKVFIKEISRQMYADAQTPCPALFYDIKEKIILVNLLKRNLEEFAVLLEASGEA